MQYVGTVGVRVRPDTSEWLREKKRIDGTTLEATVKAITDFKEALARKKELTRPTDFDVRASIKTAQMDIDRLNDQIRRTKALAEDKVQIRIDAESEELARLKNDLKQVRADAARKTKVDLDVKSALAKLKELQQARGRAAGAADGDRLDLDISAAKRNLDVLRGRLAEVRQYSKNAASVDLSIGKAQAKLKQLESAMRDATTQKQRASIEVSIGKAQAQLRQLRRTADDFRAEASKSVAIGADISAAERELKRLQALRKDAVGGADKLRMDADISAASRKLRELQDEATRLSKSTGRGIRIEADITAAQQKIRTLKREMETAGGKATLKLELEKRHAEEELHRLTEKRDVTIQADVDAARAREQLALLARRRVATINVHVAGLAEAKAAIEAATGVGMLRRMQDQLVNFASNLDRILIKFAAVGSAYSMIGVAAIRAVPGVINLGAAVVELAQGAAAGAGALGGMAAVAYTVKTAFSDLGSVTASAAGEMLALKNSIVDRMSEIRSTIREGFWGAVDVTPFRELTDKVFPQLQDGASRLSGALGELFTGLGRRMNEITSTNSLTPFFDNTTEAVHRLSPAVEDVAEGIASLVLIGSARLPGMSDAVSGVAARFKAWATDTDRVNYAIDTCVQQAKYLWTSLVSLVQIFKAVHDASRDVTGVTGLQGISQELQHISAAVRSPEAQSGLRNMFRGAQEAVQNFKSQLPPLNVMIGNLTTGIGTVAPAAGNAFGALVRGAYEVASNPVFQNGLRDLFNGIAQGLQSIDWTSVGTKLGELMTKLGEFAAAFGPVAGDIIEKFLTIGINVVGVMTKFAEFTAQHPAVIDAVIGIAVALGTLKAATNFADAIQNVQMFIGALRGLGGVVGATGAAEGAAGAAAGGGGLAGAFGGLGAAIGGIATPLLIVGAAIASAIIIFKEMWDHSEAFRTSMQNIWNNLKGQLQPAFEDFKNNTLPQLRDAWNTVSDALGAFWGAVGNFLGPATEFIASQAIPLIISAVQMVIDVFTMLITSAVDVASTVVSAFGGMKENVVGIWNAIKDLCRAVWEGIKGIITGIAHGSVSEVIGAFRRMLGGVNEALGNLIGNVGQIMGRLGNMMADAGMKVVSRFVDGFKSMIHHAWEAARHMVQGIANLLPHSPAKTGPFSGSGWGGWGEAIAAEFAAGFRRAEAAPAKAAEGVLGRLADSLDAEQAGRDVGETFAEAVADGMRGRLSAGALSGALTVDHSGLLARTGAAGAGAVSGTTVTQNFNTRVYRSGDDLYTAAPILYRQAERELRSVTR